MNVCTHRITSPGLRNRTSRRLRGNALVMHIISDMYEVDASSVTVFRTPRGAPYARWRFSEATCCASVSLSYSGDYIAACVSAEGSRCGVDIQKVRTVAPWVVAAFITQQEQRMCIACRVPETAIKIWSIKEAILKALGTGLRIHPARLSLSLTTEGEVQSVALDGERLLCVVQSVRAPAGYVCYTALLYENE